MGAKLVESFFGLVYPASDQVQHRTQKTNPELRLRLAQGLQRLSADASDSALLARADLKHRIALGYQSRPAKALTWAKYLDTQSESGPDHFDCNGTFEKYVE
jgi:hypothetical protein